MTFNKFIDVSGQIWMSWVVAKIKYLENKQLYIFFSNLNYDHLKIKFITNTLVININFYKHNLKRNFILPGQTSFSQLSVFVLSPTQLPCKQLLVKVTIPDPQVTLQSPSDHSDQTDE